MAVHWTTFRSGGTAERSEMPEDTPGFLVRRVLEAPWPTVVVLALAAAVVGWLAVQRDDRRTIVAAMVLGGLSIGVAVVGTVVLTDRERAIAATRSFVDDAVSGRVDDLLLRLHPEATLHVGVIESPGMPIEDLQRALDQLDDRHRIQQNTITLLEGAKDRTGTLWTELACLTRTDSSPGTVPSRWIFEWLPGRDGDPWRVRSITAVSVAGRRPTGRDVFR